MRPTKLLNGEDIDDFTGQTSNIKGILSEAQKEIDTYYTNFGVKVNYDGNTSSDADKDDSSSKDLTQTIRLDRTCNLKKWTSHLTNLIQRLQIHIQHGLTETRICLLLFLNYRGYCITKNAKCIYE